MDLSDDDRELDRITTYSECVHNALDIMKNEVPEHLPEWAVENLAERLAIAEMFIKKTGRTDDYTAFRKDMYEESTQVIAQVPELVHFGSDELDFMLRRLEEGYVENDEDKPEDED